jgi:hypothetical protein
MMRHIKHAQCLANAQTDVNRAVWAMNLDLDEKTLKQRSFFKDKAEVEAFIGYQDRFRASFRLFCRMV